MFITWKQKNFPPQTLHNLIYLAGGKICSEQLLYKLLKNHWFFGLGNNVLIFYVTLVFSCIIVMEMSSRLLARGKRWKIGKTFRHNIQFGYRKNPPTVMQRNASTDYFRKTKLSKKMPICSCICHHLSISILKIERRQTLIKTLAGSC